MVSVDGDEVGRDVAIVHLGVTRRHRFLSRSLVFPTLTPLGFLLSTLDNLRAVFDNQALLDEGVDCHLSFVSSCDSSRSSCSKRAGRSEVARLRTSNAPINTAPQGSGSVPTPAHVGTRVLHALR